MPRPNRYMQRSPPKAEILEPSAVREKLLQFEQEPWESTKHQGQSAALFEGLSDCSILLDETFVKMHVGKQPANSVNLFRSRGT